MAETIQGRKLFKGGNYSIAEIRYLYLFVKPKLILHNEVCTTKQNCWSVFCVFFTMITRILDRLTGILMLLDMEKWWANKDWDYLLQNSCHRSIVTRIYKTNYQFWAILGSRGCRQKKNPNCHKYATFEVSFFSPVHLTWSSRFFQKCQKNYKCWLIQSL